MNRILLLFFAPLAAWGAYRPDTVLYGAAYYHEYMPYDRLDADVALMKQAGITVVRVGESTWSSWEPRDGDFQFAWMDRIVDALHRSGIRVTSAAASAIHIDGRLVRLGWRVAKRC